MPKTVTEWRIRGASESRGPWTGRWEPHDPQATSSGRYELESYVKRNEEVWIEKRTVVYGDIERIEVATASGREQASDA